MKSKITRGKDFRGLMRYLTQRPPDEMEILSCGTITEEKPAKIVKEFRDIAKVRPDIKKPVWHCSLALPKDEKRKKEEWEAMVEAYMRRMQWPAGTLWTAVRHKDTAYDHVHIVASRVLVDQRVWEGSFEALKSIQVTQELEKEYGWQQTAGLSRSADRKVRRNERKMAERTGMEPVRERMKVAIQDALKGRPSVDVWVQKLREKGIETRLQHRKSGEVYGVSYSLDGISIKGSKLGKKYAWSGIQKKLGTAPTTDSEMLPPLTNSSKPKRSTQPAQRKHNKNPLSLRKRQRLKQRQQRQQRRD